MNKDKALHFINTHNITEIKAGEERTTFLEIWMVTVNDRIFARSWGLAERSWYHIFLKDPAGQIRCGEEIFNIKAVIPSDIKDLNPYINTAYLTKYNTGKNVRILKQLLKKNTLKRRWNLSSVNKIHQHEKAC